ncbi:MAG TPA: hypothetical protein VKG89_00725 [Solirubrobacterales bacterium]|nr:hypothetical protein [Solirubrobacterales bacterium]
MDFTRLNQGEKIAGISGVALILIMFIFKWFGIQVGLLFDQSRNAWGSYGFTDVVLFLTALAAIALALLAASDSDVGLPVAASAIVTGLGVLSLILIVISLISPPDFVSFLSGAPVDHSRKIGVWLGLIATGALTMGGYLAMQEEGTSFGGEADRFRGGGTGGTGAPPPPPSGPSAGESHGTGGPPPPPSNP